MQKRGGGRAGGVPVPTGRREALGYVAEMSVELEKVATRAGVPRAAQFLSRAAANAMACSGAAQTGTVSHPDGKEG